MPASYKNFVVPAQERGAIAIIAALTMTALFVIFLTGFAVASLVIERHKTQNIVDALALERADEMLLRPNQNWTNLPQDVTSYYLQNNAQDGTQGFDAPVISALSYNYGFSSYSAAAAGAEALDDVWMPAAVQLQAHVTPVTHAQRLLENVTFLLSPKGGQSQPSYTVYAQASIPQVQLSSFVVSRARAMLLFDLSPSMRLRYAGHENDPDSAYSALNVLKYQAFYIFAQLSQQFNFSLRAFGYTTGKTVPALEYSTKKATQYSWPEAFEHANEMLSAVMGLTTIGTQANNGTNMVDPINEALTELQENNDPLAGAPLFILLSDGEPDQVGKTPCTADLKTCNALAALATQEALSHAIRQNFLGASIESFSFLINRKNSNLREQDLEFMQSMGADQSHLPAAGGIADNFTLDKTGIGDNESIENFFQSLPVKDYCMSRSLSGLDNQKPGLFEYPAENEAIQGYFTLGNQPDGSALAHQDTYPVVQAMSFSEFFAPISRYPHVDPVPLQARLPTPNTIQQIKEALSPESQQLGKFYYDAPTKTVWLNPWLCFNILYYQDGSNGRSPAKFRIRWGRPVMGPHPSDPLTAH